VSVGTVDRVMCAAVFTIGSIGADERRIREASESQELEKKKERERAG
jgi:hypothetical protein